MNSLTKKTWRQFSKFRIIYSESMKILSVREKKANERKILIVFERNEVETCNFHHSKELMKECKARQIMHTLHTPFRKQTYMWRKRLNLIYRMTIQKSNLTMTIQKPSLKMIMSWKNDCAVDLTTCHFLWFYK